MNSPYSEYKIVQQCLAQIETQLKWGNSTSWHNDVFIELSEKIQEKTGVLLSPTTLKRVWGKVNYSSAPSISTLNALSQFAGYVNWRDFKNKNKTPLAFKIKKKIMLNSGIIITSAAVMTLVFISFYSLVGKTPRTNTNISDVVFKSKPIAEGLPNSVVFDLDLKDIDSDSIYIQQFWDKTKTIKLQPKQQQATGIYYYPGYFNAKLLVDGTIVKEHDLFIKSNGWLATVDYKPVPKYVTQDRIFNDNMALPTEVLNDIKSSEKPLWASFHFVKDFGTVSGDNFSLKTSIKNVFNDTWAVCQTVQLIILGTKGAHVIPFTIPGCVSDIDLMLNEVYLEGKEHDLSAFGVDFTTQKAIEIQLNDKQLKVFVNGTEVYSNAYNESIGRLVGLRYHFLGAIEVSHLEITDRATKNVILNEDFKK